MLVASPRPAADDAAALEGRLAGASGAARVQVLLELARASMYRAPEKVVAYSRQAVDEATALSLPRQRAQALVMLGSGHLQGGELDPARESYQEGLRAAEGLGDDALMGACLNGVAAIDMKRGNLDSALEHFDQAVLHLESVGDHESLAGVDNNVSLIYYTKGRYDQALDHMTKALGLYEEVGNVNGQGVVLNAIGNVYNKLDDPTQAREHFERALAIAGQTGNKQLLVSCLVNLGEIDIKQQSWQPALDHLGEALTIARELGNKEYISVCLNNIGDVFRQQGKVDEALRNYLGSMELFEAMHARPRLVVSYINIGRLYLLSGRLADAEAILLKAHALAQEVEELNLQKDAAEVLYGLYEKRGEYRKAYGFQREYAELEEQIFSKQNYEKIATLQSRYEAEKREREIELLKKEGQIRELRVRRQRLWILFIASGGILLGALAVVLYGRYRLKVRTNGELAAAYSKMSELATHDHLTGLFNRRSAVEHLEREIVRIARAGRPFGLLILDIDDFKTINDRYGHECGDRVLAALAGTLRRCTREQDVAARWGGEEFLLLLPETEIEGAAAAGEKVRAAIAATRVLCGPEEVAFTVTVGVTASADAEPAAECIRRADEALYEGKRTGKNTVVVASA